ncbi:hypothetical protein [Rivibacter subsaxonicus]|uniref:Uncharacterized protein n=1 Tax=Rivibacter subsaxonicus TaxID=457575 RepID=A0A4Q7VZT4_9BURK|nr:hypothetical protein [Rivibacter subsaxonicus]RZU02233.1 hypothetical protein EV670_0254 [Rivibacter subsaxonicus]
MSRGAPRSRLLQGGEWLAYAASCTLAGLLAWYLSGWALLATDGGSLSLFVSAVALRAIAAAAVGGAWIVAAQRCLELTDAELIEHGLGPRRPLRDTRGRQVALLLLLATGGIWVLLGMHDLR